LFEAKAVSQEEQEKEELKINHDAKRLHKRTNGLILFYQLIES